MFYTYILYNSEIDRYYIGQTNNLNGRLKYHNQYHTKKYTSKQTGVWHMAYYEVFESRAEAVQREKYLKSLKSKLYLQRLIEQSR